VPFETAALGGRISVEVTITEDCATCGGSGAAPGSGLKTCEECQGSGQISFGQAGFAVQRPCPACLGRGTVPVRPCTACSGRGALRQQRKVDVNVPAGTDDGSKLRLSGRGERGESGGPPGDLLLTMRVKPDRFFTRDGLDIHVTIPINFIQAAMGSKVKVRTLRGTRAVLTIPAGTQPGTRFRLRGQGIEKGGRKGDQLVEVQVQVPEQLSDEERAALEQFAEAAELRH
jgi:molecular chaperone DnaJ